MDWVTARAGAYGVGYLSPHSALGAVAIPPYPGAAGFPGVAASDGNIYSWDTSTADFKNLNAIGLQLWNESHAVDPSLGGEAQAGSSAWDYQFRQNGRANSIGVPLPFPNMDQWQAFFPAYTEHATVRDLAPGDYPFDQCANYRPDGLQAIAAMESKYRQYGENDVVSGGITKAQMRVNIMIDYNNEAAKFGCSSIPFPEAVGKVVTNETYAPVPVIGPPVNTFTPADGGPPVVLVDDGSNAPPYDPNNPPPRPPTVIPDEPNVSVDDGGGNDGTGGTGGTGGGGPSSGTSGSVSFGLIAALAVGAFLLTRNRR